MVHRANLGTMNVVWMQLRSNRTCFSCDLRKPEIVLTCGHSICNTCVQIFGRPKPEAEHTHVIDECVYCCLGSLEVALTPPTKAKCLLSIDGGGTRGVVVLEYLDVLQDIIGPDCPIQHLFHLTFGTSSGAFDFSPITPWANVVGGLIAMGLFIHHWDLARSKAMFDTLSREVFGTHRGPEAGLFRFIRRLFRCWMSDGYYDAAGLEAILKHHLGVQQRMFGSRSSSIPAKVAVTATTISDAAPVILSNYNGTRAQQPDCGKNLFGGPRHFSDRPTTQGTDISGQRTPRMNHIYGRRMYLQI